MLLNSFNFIFTYTMASIQRVVISSSFFGSAQLGAIFPKNPVRLLALLNLALSYSVPK